MISSPLFSRLAAVAGGSGGGGVAPFPQSSLLAQLRSRRGHPEMGGGGDQMVPPVAPQEGLSSLLAQAAGTKRGPRVIGPGGPFGGRGRSY